MRFFGRRPLAFSLTLAAIATMAGYALWPRATPHAAADSGHEAATDAWEAHEWRRLAWLDEKGQVAPGAYLRAVQQREENVAHYAKLVGDGFPRAMSPILWSERGPDNVAGRTRSLLIHPTNPNLMWAGTVGGGIWKSTDGGLHWTVVADRMASLAIGCLAFDPANPNTMYAGTGEGYFNSDAIGGAGMFKSVDGGNTWNLMAGTEGFGNICRIAISPSNSSIMLVSTRYGGIRRTTDGGASWNTVYAAQGSFQVLFNPSDGSKAVAHIIDYDFTANNWFHRAVFSTDGGATWSTAGGLSQIWNFGSRFELAYAKSSPNIVYADVSSGGGKIWKSVDGGQSYVQATASGSCGSSWYACPIWVDPTNPNVVVVGGYHVWRSLDGGVTLSQISNGYILTIQPHPDIHTFVGAPNYDGVTNRTVYVCNDGGVYKTPDIVTATQTNSSWARLDQTCHATQYYGADGDGPSGRIVGGTQDNGSHTLNVGSNTAILTFGGDGGFAAIDWTNPNYLYGEYVNLQIHRSTNGGGSAGYIYSGISDAGSNANFISPFILDPNNPSVMLAGGASVWRTTNVKAATVAWSAIRPAGSDKVSAIAVAPGNSNVIWVGQNNGVIQKTTNGTAATPTWTDVDNNGALSPLPDRYVTRILIDPQNSNVVYVAVGGFTDSNLWKTTDGGSNWTDITGSGVTGLPFAPIRGIARHPTQPNWLYAGTEVGLFETTDGGANWSTPDFGPNNVSVDELVFMHNSFTLLAATHGRGLYTGYIPDPATAPTGFSINRGILVSGGLPELINSDDTRLVVKSGFVLSSSESPVTIYIDCVSPFNTVTGMQFRLEAQSSTSNLQQTIDLFDYTANAWVTLDSRLATSGSDSSVSANATDPGRFIQAGTRAMRARVRYKAVGPVLGYPWQSRIDQAQWYLTP